MPQDPPAPVSEVSIACFPNCVAVWCGHCGLADMGCEKHFRVHYDADGFARGVQHINGLVKFNGVPKRTFYLHLKETGFRFNHRHDDLYKVLLKILRNLSLGYLLPKPINYCY